MIAPVSLPAPSPDLRLCRQGAGRGACGRKCVRRATIRASFGALWYSSFQYLVARTFRSHINPTQESRR